ncbi:VRR-NUC domain-containing protein [Lactococcus garvieae]|uniref:VRR-NUC domain-containing protein n=1 Tax=Lactococcus garvieae TaxID=1363 RepID=UPI000945DA03|nr:VRR-NUC domain-containing protein [Lactococcus garvieae]
MKSEHDIQNEIRMALAERGILCFRANVGRVKMKNGRWFDTGLPRGFCDLFGFRKDGQIFFIEVKNGKGRTSEKQDNFMKLVKSNGALVGVARSVEDALEIIKK